MDINNINIEDIKAKLLSLDKKVVIKYGSIFGASLLFLIKFYYFVNPSSRELKVQIQSEFKKRRNNKF